ncbi:hypothetical protein [Streptomyces sp. NPDC006691]|uniref:hypothetical protein n=1 Tax=Streptomyces sp. NPDC006691 TaxID=3364757 RepID=UPI003691F11B
MEWDSSTHLLAAAVDHLAVANWMTATINSGEDADPLDYPEAVPRPDGSQADTSMNDESGTIGSPPADSLPAPADLARFFA